MGLYAQQYIKRIPITFSGIWLDDKTVDVEFVKAGGMCFMTVPDIIYLASQSVPIFESVPSDLAPVQDVNCWGWGTAEGSDFDISFKILTDGVFVISVMPGHTSYSFEGVGMAGIYAQMFIWELNRLNQQ